jgi:hypothetical protein
MSGVSGIGARYPGSVINHQRGITELPGQYFLVSRS